MQSKPTTVDEYLASLPDDRRAAISAVRKVILDNLDKAGGYEEGIQYNMIGYYVPHSVYPAGYHCDPRQPLPFASLASQKSHMAIYLMCLYGDAEQESQFQKEWAKTGKKLDMGKSCVRFKKLEDVPLDVVGRAIKRVPVKAYIERYEAGLKAPSKRASSSPSASKPATSGKATAKTAAAKPAASGKATAKTAAAKPSAAKKTTGRTARA
jgi:hypothetical protein